MEYRKSSYSGETECVEVSSVFKKSSYSQNTGCVEVGAAFRPASRCEHYTCVEVGRPDGVPVMIRDSKLPGTSPVLQVSPAAWTAFIGTIRP